MSQEHGEKRIVVRLVEVHLLSVKCVLIESLAYQLSLVEGIGSLRRPFRKLDGICNGQATTLIGMQRLENKQALLR